MSNRVLDVPALMDVAIGKTQFMRARWHVAREVASTLVVPWCVAAEAARQLDTNGRAELRNALAAPMVVLGSHDFMSAAGCGQLMDRAGGAAGWDAAQVVWEAARRGWPVVTDEAHLDRLLRLDPFMVFERLP
ncbi:hypothetical protein [Actinomadura alba]|uniref:hypothetical protein n=1 Tax=Actinomadura alba TaxID=406431 RepID=UPI0031DE540C